MKAFELNRLLQQAEQGGGPYLEFLRAPWLSMGIYRLPADGSDKQLPHTEDEVYYVLQGRGRFRPDSLDPVDLSRPYRAPLDLGSPHAPAGLVAGDFRGL